MLCGHFSRVRVFVTPWTAARQAPLSTGFSRQEHCNGLPCPERHCNHALFPWSHQPGCRATSSRALNIPSLLPRGLFWRTASFCLCIAHCLLFRSQIENKQTRKEKKTPLSILSKTASTSNHYHTIVFSFLYISYLSPGCYNKIPDFK